MVRVDEDGILKRVYEGRVKGAGIKGRPPVKWITEWMKFGRDLADEG